jgi:flagellar hook assembly protein FlgD
MSTEEYAFVVTDGFGDIRVFGNYPNPFSDQTIISFYVDSDNEIDDLSIKIYTTSGRLVRQTMLTLDESVATDNIRTPYYHELIWDGTDDDGVPVANGVYFLVLSGSYKGKTITHTLKIARLQ